MQNWIKKQLNKKKELLNEIKRARENYKSRYQHSIITLKYLEKVANYLKQTKNLYFYSIRKNNIKKYMKIRKKVLLEVIEYGKDKKHHRHAITNKKLKKIKWTKQEEKKIKPSQIEKVLMYMQKEQKNKLRWTINKIPKRLNEWFKKTSKNELEKEIEYNYKQRYDIKDFEEAEKNNLKMKNVSEQKKINILIIKQIVKLTNAIHLDVCNELELRITNKNARKNNSWYTIEKWKYMDMVWKKLDKSLIWYVLNMVISNGINNKSTDELLLEIGQTVITEYLKLKEEVNKKIMILLGVDILKIIEEILIKNKSIKIWRDSEEETNAILEKESLTHKTNLTTEFKKLIFLTNEIIPNQGIFKKPKKLHEKNKTGLHYYKKLNSSYLDDRLIIKEPMYKALNELQEQRWWINNNMLEYVLSNIENIWESKVKKYNNIEEIKKPDYNVLKETTLEKINKVLNKLNIKGLMLKEQMYNDIILVRSKIKESTEKSRTNVKYLLKKLIPNIKPIELDELIELCLEKITKYKELGKEYAKYKNFLLQKKSLDDKFKKLKRIIMQLFIWKYDYMSDDGKESIYFLWKPDKRGRLYQLSELTPLLDKWIRRLLTFSEPYLLKPYKDIIKISISKSYYGGNETDENYLKKFNLNEKELLDIEYNREQADDEPGYICYTLEYINYLKDPNNYKTNVLLQLDATNNVYQILSLLTNDKELAKKVNVCNNEENIPMDFYGIMSKEITQYVGVEIPRKLIKKSIMCYAYGLTSYGRMEYLREENQKLVHPFSNEELKTISDKIEDILMNNYKSIVLIREILESLVYKKFDKKGTLEERIVLIDNLFLTYKHIMYEYKKELVIFTNMNKILNKREKTRVNLIEKLPILDIKKMKTSITANFVHSIDASCMMLLMIGVNELRTENITNNTKYLRVFPIHDCFMFPAPIHNIIKPIFKKCLINLELDKKIIRLYKDNGIEIENNGLIKKYLNLLDNNNLKVDDIQNANYILT